MIISRTQNDSQPSPWRFFPDTDDSFQSAWHFLTDCLKIPSRKHDLRLTQLPRDYFPNTQFHF